MKRLFLHIGTHKTGTSSFQLSLKKNEEDLIANGFRTVFGPVYRGKKLAPNKKGANNNFFANLLLRPEVRSGARIRGWVPELTRDQCVRELENQANEISKFDEETLIITSEVLCFLRTPYEQELLQKFVKDVGRETHSLVVFRNEKEWRASWENQLTKDINVAREIAREKDRDASILGDWYYDKAKIREFWAPFNLREIEYEAQRNIVQTLYSEMGVSLESEKTDVFINLRQQDPTPSQKNASSPEGIFKKLAQLIKR